MIIKRDGRKENFNKTKIINAISKAFIEVDGSLDNYSLDKANHIAEYIYNESLSNPNMDIEYIQDLVEKGLMNTKRKDVAKAYIIYRNDRNRARGNIDNEVEEIVNDKEDGYWKSENSNKNSTLVTTQRDYLAGALSTNISKRRLLPKEVVDAHDAGIIHFHDMDYFAQKALTNCELLNLEDMLQNGTILNNVLIEKPHKFITAATIATQIILGVTSSTYGGCTITLTHLAPFVRDSYNKYLKTYLDRGLDKDVAEKFAEEDTKKEVNAGVQTFNYQINSMCNSNGQAPFLSVCMYLGETEEYKKELALIIEEFLRQRILGFKNEKGIYITPAFPKLLYVLEEDNIHEDSKYFYLTKLAAECTSKRMVPDYISEKIMKKYKIDEKMRGNCYPCMGCRSFLTPYVDENGKSKYYGRFNCGVVTINLPHIALSSEGDFDKFWKLFEERTELCHEALQCRINRLKGTSSDVAPLIWQHGGLARLKKHEKIDKLLYGGYCTISLGYVGLYETVKYMTGYSHTDEKGKPFAIEVMEALNKKTMQWREAENIHYSLYGTPEESTTYKFAKALQKFPIIEDINDKDYVTNSYHVSVKEDIDAFTKLKFESEFQQLSPGGAISYIETPNMSNNIPVVIELIKYMYENIMYAEINSKFDHCNECGYDGEIEIKGEPGGLYWECPNCGCKDQSKMHVARRVCGYISTNYFNQGRTDEIRNRKLHLDN
jgi:ribonucleoside-triphosphate reductase